MKLYAAAAVLTPALFLLPLLAGCGGKDETRGWEMGEAYHTVFENQKLNPDAEPDGGMVEGLDGEKAKAAYIRYEKDEIGKKKKGKGTTMETTIKQN